MARRDELTVEQARAKLAELGSGREKDVEREVTKLYEMAGCVVVKLSQPHRAEGMTRGTPDLRIYHPKYKWAWWHEVKGSRGQQSVYQRAFQELVEGVGESYVLGGMDAAIEALRRRGLIE